MNRVEILSKKITEKILNGTYGKSGERFLSVRDICDTEKISYTLAYSIFQRLEKEHIIFLIKQKWFLTYGIANEGCPLRNNSTEKLIGIHIKEINNSYISSIITSLKAQLEALDYSIIIETSENDSDKELKILDHFIRLGCCGVINFSSTKSNLSNFYKLYPLPMVFIGRLIRISETESMPCVLTDNFRAGRQVASEFIKKGYKHFYFAGIESLPNKQDERLKGFIEELTTNHQIPVTDDNVFKTEYSKDIDFNNFCAKIAKTASAQSPVAIFCINDLFASKILMGLVSLGVDIPNAVGIIGYDDLPICGFTKPSLSTVSYSFKELATQTLNLLFSITEKTPQRNCKKIIMNFIINRDSVIK